MFQIYLPIAEMPVNILVILLLGWLTGLLSGMFGVGGGFLMTPLLMFIGVPPNVAVATSTNQIIASSFSGFMAHLRRNNVDFKMGTLLLIGGFVGSTLGVSLFKLLKNLGQIDLTISLIYVVFLGSIGGMMAYESTRTLLNRRAGITIQKRKKTNWLRQVPLPFMMQFPRSELEVSAILPLVIGTVVGILVSLMGIGGGFFLIPAMIYILGMPTSVVIGTSLFQIIFTTANVTLLQSLTTHSVDIVLAVFLLTGSVIGAQFGTRLALRFPSDILRAMLAFMVLSVVIKLAFGLFVAPSAPYEIIPQEVME